MSIPNTMTMEMPEESFLVSGSEHLTRTDVLKRRMHFVKKLKKIYCDHYWLLMEDVKSKFREYYWDYGESPFVEEEVNKHLNACRDGVEGLMFAPKFHEVIAQYVRVIKNKRRAALKAKMEKADEKDDISI
ncbi:hypothetical protein Leryth_019449 [Lithospermum erythrorhizon]|nr:hypothetical protein Leryth_019449 [Lithospermum erythrorhizon]